MSEISATTVAVNRYAPEGSEAVQLYNYNGAEGLTLGQLCAAFSLRRAALLENQSVGIMNRIVAGSDRLDMLSDYAQRAVKADALDAGARASLYDEIKAYLGGIGTDTSTLPANLDGYENRMSMFTAIKTKLDEGTSTVDRLAISLETAVTRRDTVYAMSTTIVKHYTASCLSQARVF